VLDLQRRGAADAKQQRPATAPAGRVVDPQRLTAAGQRGTDDRRPVGEQAGLGEAAPARRRIEDAGKQFRHLQASLAGPTLSRVLVCRHLSPRPLPHQITV
jgi:hypothetical protein